MNITIQGEPVEESFENLHDLLSEALRSLEEHFPEIAWGGEITE